MEQFFFKTKLEHYFDGALTLDWTWSGYAVAVIAIVLVTYLVLGFTSLSRATPNSGWLTSWLLRSALIALLLFVFLNPTLRYESTEAEPARLAIVLDNSLSMSVADRDDGTTRGERMLAAFSPVDGAVTELLADHYEIEHFGFGSDINTMTAADEFDFAAPESNVGRALLELANKDFAGVILVTDGNASGPNTERALNALVGAGKRLFTVGVGADQLKSDLNIVAVDLPLESLAGDTVTAELTVNHPGFETQAVTLVIEQDGLIMAERDVVLNDDTSSRINVSFEIEDPGARNLSFRFMPSPADSIPANNRIDQSINVTDDRYRILHFEGEPRFEVKFIRRALTDENNLNLTSLIRTADNKFFRIGLLDEDELATGFPTARTELYEYDVVILGSVSRTLLSDQQLELLRDFVAVRGGSLLLLGGAGSFGEGGYADSVLEQLMPVYIDQENEDLFTKVTVTPTPMGNQSALLANLFANTDPGFSINADAAERWAELPRLTVVNPITRAKPGATILLQGVDERLDRYIVLAAHRYGLGRVVALPVRDTWRWQIHADIAPEDLTHESFWRRLLRHLAKSAQQRTRLEVDNSRAVVGSKVAVNVLHLDEYFDTAGSLTDNGLGLHITSPTGAIERVTADITGGTAGRLLASFNAAEVGRYEIRLDDEAKTSSNSPSVHVDVDRDGDELRRVNRDTRALRSLAERGGGQYFDIDALDQLPDAIDSAEPDRTQTKSISLSDAPFLLLLLIALIVAELLLRRQKRFA